MEIIEPVVLAEKLELVDVEYKKTGKSWALRVFIDKPDGVTLEDCQKVSRQIEDLIDLEEWISSKYVLEVSSPGLDRPLKKEREFLKYKNKRVRVRTFSPIENRRDFSGAIRDCKNQTLFLEEGDGRSKYAAWRCPTPGN